MSREFVLSSYGVTMVGLKEEKVSREDYQKMEYYTWRNFAEVFPNMFVEDPDGIVELDDGTLTATLKAQQCEKSEEFGLAITKYTLTGKAKNVIFGQVENTLEGYEIVSEENKGTTHSIIISKGHCEILIVKEVGNWDQDFAYALEPTEGELSNTTIPDDLSVVQRLYSVVVPKPTCRLYQLGSKIGSIGLNSLNTTNNQSFTNFGLPTISSPNYGQNTTPLPNYGQNTITPVSNYGNTTTKFVLNLLFKNCNTSTSLHNPYRIHSSTAVLSRNI
jgi:hypothetical protein